MLPGGPYNPNEYEKEILDFWLSNKFYKPEFNPEKDSVLSTEEMKMDSRKSWALICPPPNAYARPHIGNISGYAYQDAMARFQRMQGKKVLVLPGKDHAGLEGEGVFVREVLDKKGRNKFEMKREDFYQEMMEFFQENMDIAKKDELDIGLSADFERNTFTLDSEIVETVLDTFVEMYNSKMIYKGVRIVNWDPKARTAVADNQIEYIDAKTPFVYFKYGFLEPEKKALELKNKFEGKETLWKINENKKENSYLLGERHDGVKVMGVGYDDVSEGNEVSGLVIGIQMRLDGDFRLVVRSIDFTGDIEEKISQANLDMFKETAGGHIIIFKDYPEDKFYTNGFILGTVRPETKFGDTAIAFNPKDKRYKSFEGKKVNVKTLNGISTLNIISDYSVDSEFGTGLVKITPAHSQTDWEIANRHPEECLPAKQVIGYDLKLNHLTGKYSGMKIKEAREQILKDMKEQGYLVHIDENYQNRIQIAERTKAPIEPLLSSQWYLKYDQKDNDIKQAAINMVKNKEVVIHPENMESKFFHWMENLRDWAISRSLWWGYRLPVWYAGEIKEEIGEDGQVKEFIKVSETWIELDYSNPNHLRVQKESPDLEKGKLILIPGKHGYAQRKLFPDLNKSFPNSITVQIENIHNPLIENYIKALEKVSFNTNDIVVAHSLGSRAIIRFILDNKIKLKHLILLAPGARLKRKDNGRDKNYVGLIENINNYEDLKNYVEKISLVYSNDELITKEQFEKFAQIINAEVYYEENKKHYAGENYEYNSEKVEELLLEYKDILLTKTWIQDENVLDTWFSSGQWVYATLKKYNLMDTFFPTDVLVSAHDILENWDSRMIMFTYFKHKKIPFKDLFLTGLVLGKDGQKMSKSKGNMIDVDKVRDQYGTDSLRMAYFYQNSAGGSYVINDEKLKNFKNFNNKIWNAARFVLMNIENLEETNVYPLSRDDLKYESNKKLLTHIKEIKEKVTNNINDFEFGHATENLYENFWHFFCDICLEEAKEHLYEFKDKETGKIKSSPKVEEKIETQKVLLLALKEYLKMLHPFIPFITEKIWQEIPKEKGDFRSLMYTNWLK